MATERTNGDLGRLLREWRERTLLTQEQLAERAGLSVRSIRRYERGGPAGRPQSASIRLLADALDLSPAERALLVETTRESAPARLRQLPGPPPLFTGREPELADLDRISDPTRLVIATIAGVPGVGKTTLAVQAAHRVAARYPDEHVYLDLHGYTRGMRPTEPGEALDRILRSLGVPPEQIPPDPDDRAALYRSRLADHQALILLDNVATEAQVTPLLPGTPGCLVLVTSRRLLPGLDHVHTISLDLLPLPDAVTLFTRAAGPQRVHDEPPARVTEIVELCGRLPLAVRIAAARLSSRPSWTVTHLAERLKARRHLLTELEAGERSVTAALDLSYLQLTAAQRRAYRLLGLHPGADLTVHAAAALLDTSPTRAERLIDRLLDSHLLQEPAPGHHRFHDLIRTHSITTAHADEPEPERRAALTRLFDHCRHSASAAMDVAYPYERARRPDVPPSDVPPPVLNDAATAIAWLDAELATLLAVTRHAADHGWPDHARDLAATLHAHLIGRGRYPAAELLHNRVLTVARATGDRSAEQVALANLGRTYLKQGRNEQAFEAFTQAQQLARDTGNRSSELDALAGLGWQHRQQGRHHEAITCFEQAHEIAQAIGSRHGELNAINGLASTRRVLGQHDQAAETYQRALELSREIGNQNLQFEAFQGMGRLHFAAGRHDQELACHREALDLATRLHQPSDQANAHDGLACAYQALDQPEQARHHWQQALDTLTDLGAENTTDGEVTTTGIRARLDQPPPR